ncbi:MAG: HAMP domain-containing histidine kinase [Promethearchaeota archaeon]|nr:MAG: HAMP domain-containing histidine kinase [Candidatus Lokiarchaeota archaeon]
MGLEIKEGFKFKKLLFSKLNRKLTIIFLLVALVAPSLSVYYLYTMTVESLTETIAPETSALIKTVAIGIISLIAIDAAIVGFYVSRSISKPIVELFKATKEVEKGNYDIELDVKTGDEIEMLVQAFNRTTKALGKLEEERKEIDNAKSEFLSITSHELRSPMTPMKAQLQMMTEGYFGKLNKKQKESIHIITRNADRLDSIICDFLEISRIEAAHLKFNFIETDITKLIDETVQFMNGFATEKNIKLKAETGEIPIIEADPDRITQVLRNLINNAIKFSKKDSTVEISAYRKNNEILFSVRDYGIGLSPENQIKIFEPFYQVEYANRRSHGGTGLGLAICRGIVESQKGKIWVDSKPESGSKFYFTFPMNPVYEIEPIKVLFSPKGKINKKVKEEFKTILGPLGAGEFEELKNKNAITKQDLIQYINSLEKQFILSPERSESFKDRINEIFGEEKALINEEKDTSFEIKGLDEVG